MKSIQKGITESYTRVRRVKIISIPEQERYRFVPDSSPGGEGESVIVVIGFRQQSAKR